MLRAKSFFLKFSDEVTIEETRTGKILERNGPTSRIYVAGLLIAEEENFAFSYDITSLTAAMKKALNRERTNVGRTAYTERVKSMLLQTKSPRVAQTLAHQLMALERGTGSDEVRWKEVAVHSCKILNASGEYLFVTASQLMSNASALDHARSDGIQIITVPDNILVEVAGGQDVTGAPIRDLGLYQSEWNDSFSFDWVLVEDMKAPERTVFEQTDRIAALVGGLPKHVQAIRVSNTMRQDFLSGTDALGLWDPQTSSIVVRRDQLKTLESFAATLLHEVAHAVGGNDDVTRGFEHDLTRFLGLAAAAAITHAPSKNLSWQSMTRSFTDLVRGKSQPRPAVQPNSAPTFNESDVEVVRLSAESMVRVVNESIQIANGSKNIETRRSRVRVALEKLDQLREVAGEYPFLKIERLEDVERDLAKIDHETDVLQNPSAH